MIENLTLGPEVTYDFDNIFKGATEEEVRRVNKFMTDLENEGIPLRSVTRIIENKTRLNTYDFSEIDSMNKTNSCSSPFDYDGSGNFIGRRFNLLFGSGVLEYDRSKKDFDFSFKYQTSDRIQGEILSRLGLDNIQIGMNPTIILYENRVHPADVKKVKKAYREIETVGKKLEIAPEISRKINSHLRRK